jgi:hypothetical protein
MLKIRRSKVRNVISAVLGTLVMVVSTGALGQSAACSSAVLSDVQGNVLVSTKDGMSAGIDKQTLGISSRVTTTSRASATLTFNCGCVVSLKENERIDIGDTPATCAALLAAVTAVPVAAAIGAATASAGVFSGTTALVGVGVGVGGYLVYRNNRNQSPN